MNLSSTLLENAVNQIASLPGVGKKTALRLTLHLLRRTPEEVEQFTHAISAFRNEVHYCEKCHNISDTALCPICSSLNRDTKTICVVEDVQDVMQIENTGQYQGLYHVLGGVISPMNGVGPKDIEVESLLTRIENEQVREVILALPATMEGDTTGFYIYRRLISTLPDNGASLTVTQIARGVAVGNELEYTDEITLGRSILNRTEFKA